jgi:hypothetical protein
MMHAINILTAAVWQQSEDTSTIQHAYDHRASKRRIQCKAAFTEQLTVSTRCVGYIAAVLVRAIPSAFLLSTSDEDMLRSLFET